MNKETGGPAFPDGSTNQWGHPINHGMTLRDYVAAKAMQGMLPDALAHNATYGELCIEAYKLADAMLAAREAA